MAEGNRSYYEVLGLSENATPEEVKKAYFRLVRVHSPEKDPEKFQEIRKAYEALKDGPPKEEEEETFPEPTDPLALHYLHMAYHCIKYEDDKSAARYIEDALDFVPDDPFLLLLLSKVQKRAGNPRKSGNTAKKLAAVAPTFAEAYALAGSGFFGGGWYKKAYPEYKKAVALGFHDLDFLAEFADVADANGDHAQAVAQRLKILDDTKWEKSNLFLAYYLFFKMMENCREEKEAIEILERYTKFLRSNKRFTKGNDLDFVAPAMLLVGRRSRLLTKPRVNAALDACLAAVQELGLETEKRVHDCRMEAVYTAVEIDFLVDEDWTELFASVFYKRFDDEHMWRYSVLDDLLCLMKEREASTQTVARLESNYPFFYTALQGYCDIFKQENFEEIFEKFLTEYARLSEDYEGGAFYKRYPEEVFRGKGKLMHTGPAPFVRENKKPGRIDPCPCGSGKKFKKCCIGKGIYD